MQGVVARRNNFVEPILDFLEDAYRDFAALTGRDYGLVTQYKTRPAGKNRNMMEKITGMAIMTFCCTGSGEEGDSFTWMNEVMAMMIGST